MKTVLRSTVALAVFALFAAGVLAAPTSFMVPMGTPVTLAFDQSLSSATAKAGQTVALHVRDPLIVGGHTVLKPGTKLTGIISKVSKRKPYGINAELRIALQPVATPYGKHLRLEPQTTGKALGGKKTAKAGAATAGGAIVLGPVGLIGGYFVKGKPVTIKAGHLLPTQVASDTWLRLR